MKPYVSNIEEDTLDNENFRKVLHTGENSQLVVMALKPGEEIGMETHPDTDQFIRVESGEGKAIIDSGEYELKDDFAVVIPAGSKHNVINTSNEEKLKLYTVYSPPEHPAGTIHTTKEEADKYEEEHH